MKKYKARIEQTGQDAPAIVVVDNSAELDLTWQRSQSGKYHGVSQTQIGGAGYPYTVCSISHEFIPSFFAEGNGNCYFRAYVSDPYTIEVLSMKDDGGLRDDLLSYYIEQYITIEFFDPAP